MTLTTGLCNGKILGWFVSYDVVGISLALGQSIEQDDFIAVIGRGIRLLSSHANSDKSCLISPGSRGSITVQGWP